MATFNFASYYMNTALSDVTIRVTLPDGSPVQPDLPGHGLLLSNVSPFFKEEIEDKGTMTLVVGQEPLQAEAAHALVQYVYQGVLPDSSQQQALIVHMLHLAQVFAVQSCRAACLRALMAVQQQHLQLDAIHVAFSLLSAQSGSPGLPQLLQHCLGHLQQLLGDLEVTLSDQTLLSHLQQLPHPALLALLQDERTSAASENSVLAAVQSWLAAQPHGAVDVSQRQQLASAVRLPLLEPTYLATVLPRMQWLLEILGPQGLAAAAGAARGMFDPHAGPCLSNTRACGVSADWLAGPRPLPASCTDDQERGPGMSIEWALPLTQVRQAFEAACEVGAAVAAARRKAEAQAAAAAAAAARSQRSEAAAAAALAAAGQHGWGASGAAAVSAAAAAAVSFGATIFGKRKRAEQQADAAVAAAPSGIVHASRQAAAGGNEADTLQRTRKQRNAAARSMLQRQSVQQLMLHFMHSQARFSSSSSSSSSFRWAARDAAARCAAAVEAVLHGAALCRLHVAPGPLLPAASRQPGRAA
ncbi:hypothetical protein COO60DRAFT_762509 [Scenedesmus sp. NREL 46B-D3]|nr:hypothetical protein COO60DRAFT_762509 [Scenedesmus sp. NREL 46B-D3]